jgi:hypothetical protein
MGKTRARSIFVALLFSSGRLPDEAEGAFLNDFLRRIKKTWSYSPMESSLNRSLHPRHPPGVTRKGEKGFQPIQRVALELPSDDHRLSAPSLATLPFFTVEANFSHPPRPTIPPWTASPAHVGSVHASRVVFGSTSYLDSLSSQRCQAHHQG